MQPWILEKERLQKVAREIDPSVILTTKDSWFWKLLAWILFLVTFTKMRKETFLEDFATTLGNIQAYPRAWKDYIVEEIIVHESRHTKQARWFGFFIHPLLGIPLMAVFYLLLPLPLGLAYFRYRLELDADKTYWKYLIKKGFASERIYSRAICFARTISSSNYGWAWPRSWAEETFHKEVSKLLNNKE